MIHGNGVLHRTTKEWYWCEEAIYLKKKKKSIYCAVLKEGHAVQKYWKSKWARVIQGLLYQKNTANCRKVTLTEQVGQIQKFLCDSNAWLEQLSFEMAHDSPGSAICMSVCHSRLHLVADEIQRAFHTEISFIPFWTWKGEHEEEMPFPSLDVYDWVGFFSKG